MAMKAPYPQMPDCCWALEGEKDEGRDEAEPRPFPVSPCPHSLHLYLLLSSCF